MVRRWMFGLCIFAACGNDKAQVPRDAASDGNPDVAIDASLYPPCPNPRAGTTVSFREIGRVSITGAVLATSPPNDARLFVVEQVGAVRIFKDEVLQSVPFIDLSKAAGGPVIGGEGNGDEKGLLGLAFHPRFAVNHQFFLFFTGTRDGNFQNFLIRCQASDANPDVADPAMCVELMVFRHPYTNHEGGMMEFGDDGYLYLGTGDGGGGGDPFGYGQDPNAVLGKMLRLDVDNKLPGKQYGIPPSNPYASGGGAPEVFMRGLRNPWRWSFDRATGDMWIGDVGQQLIEELDVVRPAQQNGANLGWSIYEGKLCCETQPYHCASEAPAQQCDPTNQVFPLDSRMNSRTGWRAIIGGQMYRGSCFPDIAGWYFYTDFSQRDLIKARLQSDGSLEIVDSTLKVPANPSSLHSDSRGELYLTTADGYVYRLEAGP